MAHPQSRACTILSLTLLLALACKETPTVPTAQEERIGKPRRLMTAEDSASYFASRPAPSGTATTSSVTSIPLKSGDSIVVSITSYECSGNPETVNVYGVISGIVAAGSCDGGLTGIQVTLGPASADGTIYFTATHQAFGEGPAGQVSGTPPTYTVGLDDGAGDLDYNDVILSVHIVSSEPRVDCTPNPQRGVKVTCTAWGSGVEVTDWTFDGSTYSNASLRITGPSSDSTWEGTAVTSGTVSATVTVNGQPRSEPLTAAINVVARTGTAWHFGPPDDWSYSQGTGLDYCYQGTFALPAGGTIGWSTRKGDCDGTPITPVPRLARNSGYTIAQVSTGPNAGVWYVTSVSYRMDTESNLTTAILDGSSLVYQLVDKAEKRDCNKGGGPAVTAVNFYTFNAKCRKNDLTPMFTALWLHEGRGLSNSSGHQGQLELAAANPNNDMHGILEGVFGIGETNTRDLVFDEVDTITQRLVGVFSDHTYVRNNGCFDAWRWNVPTSVFVFVRVHCV